MKTIAILELASAAFVGIALIGQISSRDRSGSAGWLKLTLLSVMIHLIADALAYTLTGPQYPFALRYAVNFLAYGMAAADLFAFIKYYETYISDKAALGRWRFRIPLTAAAIYGAAIAVLFVSGGLVAYENGIVTAVYDIPLWLRLFCLLIMLYTPAVALRFRKEIGVKATALLGLYCLSPIVSIIIAIYTEEEYSIILGAAAVLLVAMILQEEERERQRALERRQLAAVEAAVQEESVFVIDCARDRRRTITDNSVSGRNYSDDESYSAAFLRYVDSFVGEPDREMMRRFASPSYLLECLKNENSVSVRYRDWTTGVQRFYMMKYTRYSDTEVLQSFRSNDAEMVNNLLFEKLKDNYFAIFGVDLKTGLMRSYKDDPLHVAGEEGEITALSATMMNLASHFEGETKAFFERNSDVEKIKKRFAKEDRAEFIYRSPLSGRKWCDITGIVFERDADGTPSLFCYAFNYLDEEAGKLQDMREKLEAALEEAREANAVIAGQQLQAGIAEQARKEQIAKTAGTESTYIVDPETERFQILAQNEYLAGKYPEEGDFNTAFAKYAANDIFEPDRKKAAEAISVPAMVSHLDKEDEYIVRYRDISKGYPRWYEMRAVRLSDREILYGFSDRDDAIITQMMADNFRESYFGLYYINLDAGLAQISKTGHPEITGEAGECVPYSPLMKRIASASRGEAAEFFLRISDIDYIRKRFASEDIAYHVYKSYLFNGNRYVNYTGRVLQRHEDGTPSVFALAFSLLDEEAAAKEEADRKLKDAFAAAEAANKARTNFVNSFKALYQVMYSIDLRTCKTDFLYGDEEAKKFLPIFDADTPEGIFDNFKKYYIDSVIVPEDRERVESIMNVPNMFRTLKTAASMSVNYRVRRNLVDPVYTEMSIIRAAEEDGEPSAVIMAFRMTGEELREALETRKKLEADARIIGALSEDFNCVDYVEIMDRKEEDVSVEVRSSDLMRRNIPEWASVGSVTGKMKLFSERLVYGPDRELFNQSMRREAILRALENSDTYYFNTRLLIDNELRYYQMKTSAIRENGKLIGIVVGTRSVDEYTRKELENQKQLETALYKAESASRAKTDFLFSMSHDIRTPMNAILGFTEMARKHLDCGEKLSDYLGKIDASGRQLLEFINQVLEMSRIASGRMELEESPVNIIERFNASVTVLSEQARARGLEFRYSLSDVEHVNVFADTAKMSSVTMNVTGNAMKYTPVGGRIDYSLREIAPRKPGFATYVFTVADTGIGMSAEFLTHVYEPFSREQTSTVSRIQGTGLGMSIVKEIIDFVGGSIEVKSEPGRGTRFDITIDFRINGEAGNRAKEEPPAKEVSLKGKTALVVEDNEMNRDIAADILEEEGLAVETAADGSEAVDLLKEKGPGYYDFILMDIQMPIMNGYEATKAIRAMYPDRHIPIIAVSANAFDEDRRASKEAGMDDHVAKPVDIQKLLGTITKFLFPEADK